MITVQTFLPYADFKKSAQALDYRRLGKQRVECLQLLRGQWPNHPVSKMWSDYKYQLANYGLAICDAWLILGYNDSCYDKILIEQESFQDTGLPPWFGREDFHASHRSNLLTKDYSFYKDKFPGDKPGLPYVWPC